MMQLICIETLLEKLEEMKGKNKDRPLGATMNMGLNQAIAVVNSMVVFEVMEDGNGKAD